MGYKIPRLEQVIKFKIANVFQREIADPRMGMLTVTEVKLAKDLGHCIVRYSVLGDEGARSKTERLLEDSRGFIQREVAKILRTRRAPQLEFEFDERVEGSIRVAEMLRKELGESAEGEDLQDNETVDAEADETPGNDDHRDA